MARKTQKHEAGKADLLPGERRIVAINGRSVGIFNVNGEYYALHNRCPHMAGRLCEGPITGTTQYTTKTEFVYGQENEIVRCGWHGWEFEIQTGKCLVDSRVQAKTFEVLIEENTVLVCI